MVIIGPSGKWKSTLLRSMNLLEEASKGKVIFEGVDITDKKNDLLLCVKRWVWYSNNSTSSQYDSDGKYHFVTN